MARRIYTRSGDSGTTGIHGGVRVAKDDVRVEAYGALDELNCQIGVVRSLMYARSAPDEKQGGDDGFPEDILFRIQDNLMPLMSLVATPSAQREGNPNALPDSLVEDVERHIDAFTAEAGESACFLLPGGTPVAAQLQLARAVCRRAERRLWTLHRLDPVPGDILRYVNRLSDLFFIMARWENVRWGLREERWKSFNYKRKSK